MSKVYSSTDIEALNKCVRAIELCSPEDRQTVVQYLARKYREQPVDFMAGLASPSAPTNGANAAS